MKTLCMIFIVAILSLNLNAQSQYADAMKAALENFGSSGSIDELIASASQFERIAEAESEEWLPGYYASMIYCIITFGTQKPEKKESYLTQAQNLLDNAMKISPDESELHTLQGMIYQAFIGIDPARNGQTYSAKANGAFQTAIKLNGDNPRPYYLQAVSIMHTPEEYGGGKKAALPLFEQALALFEKQSSVKPFYPDWGKEDCEKNIQACKKDQNMSEK